MRTLEVHWGSASRWAVANLMRTLCEEACCTAKLRVTKPPLLWNWRRLDDGRYFPACIPCSNKAGKGTLLKDGHLNSKTHAQNTCNLCNQSYYDFPRRFFFEAWRKTTLAIASKSVFPPPRRLLERHRDRWSRWSPFLLFYRGR